MPKPSLIEEDSILENHIIETLLAGLKRWRPDLSYPESHSDMQACVRGLLVTFDIKRRPLPVPLRLVCDNCEGIGHLITKSEEHRREVTTCVDCKGRGYSLGQ